MRFDLIFLDIELGETTGIVVGNAIRKDFKDNISKIVFVTSKKGYEEQLFDVQPFNFIKKPINKEEVYKVLDLVVEMSEIEDVIFTVTTREKTTRVSKKEIIYFEKDGKKVKIVTERFEEFFNSSLEKVEKDLPSYFIKPHGSFIV